IVQAEQPSVGAPDRAVARAVDVDDGRAFLAQRLPHHAAPAGPEGAHDVVGLVGRRRGSEPERVGRLDADEVGADVGHGQILPSVSARWIDSAASRPAATAATVRSSRASATQSPPAHTFAIEVRPSASTLMRPLSSAIMLPLPFSGAGSKLWPMALNTWSASITTVSPVPTSRPSRMSVYSISIATRRPDASMIRRGWSQWRLSTPREPARSVLRRAAFLASWPPRAQVV